MIKGYIITHEEIEQLKNLLSSVSSRKVEVYGLGEPRTELREEDYEDISGPRHTRHVPLDESYSYYKPL